MIWFSLVFNYIGLTAIAAAMESHRRTFPRVANHFRPARLFAIGGISQAVALAVAVFTFKLVPGLVLWVIGWAACGLIVSLLLAFRPKLLPLPAIALALISAANWFGLV